MSRFIIYILHHPSSNRMYVGRSSSGLQRPKMHGRVKRPHYPVQYWARSLKERGLNYEISILEECDSTNALNEAEQFHIAYQKSIGFKLLNCTDGGYGSQNPRPETRQRMSAAKAGKSLLPEHRAKIAASLLGRTFSDQWRRKISEAKKGKCLAAKKRFSELNIRRTGTPLSLNHRTKLSVAQRSSEAAVIARQLVFGKKGAEHPRAKLTAEEALFIKLSADPCMVVAARFGVSRSTVYAIRSGQNWRVLK